MARAPCPAPPVPSSAPTPPPEDDGSAAVRDPGNASPGASDAPGPHPAAGRTTVARSPGPTPPFPSAASTPPAADDGSPAAREPNDASRGVSDAPDLPAAGGLSAMARAPCPAPPVPSGPHDADDDSATAREPSNASHGASDPSDSRPAGGRSALARAPCPAPPVPSSAPTPPPADDGSATAPEPSNASHGASNQSDAHPAGGRTTVARAPCPAPPVPATASTSPPEDDGSAAVREPGNASPGASDAPDPHPANGRTAMGHAPCPAPSVPPSPLADDNGSATACEPGNASPGASDAPDPHLAGGRAARARAPRTASPVRSAASGPPSGTPTAAARAAVVPAAAVREAVERLASARAAAARLAAAGIAVVRRAAGHPDPAHLAAVRPAVHRLATAKHFVPAAVFVVCLAAYVSNGDFLPGSDQQGNMLFSINLLKRHSLSLGPLDAPYSFSWTLQQPGEQPLRVTVEHWNGAADEAYRDGRLQPREHHFYLAETTRHEVFVNTFGLGAPLFGLPVYALLDLFVDIENDRFWWWHGGALTASLLTAGAALLVLLAARRFVRPLPAALVALAFGLGSCVWPISSQALWQHPASTFCLSLGAWFLLRSADRRDAAAWCGAALGMAVLCRPATAVAAVCVGAYLLWTDRRRCVAYVLGGLPFLAILAIYNGYYFGSPLVFGQTVVSKIVALRATGSENLWQGSWAESLPGLLISPGRGLLWFSPVLALALASVPAVWREARYRPLIPLLAAVVLMILVAGKWFEWWGGTVWGYRAIVDTTPFLALLLVPIVERMLAARGTRVVFAALLLWSIGAQFVGAYSYNLIGWIDQWRERDNPDYTSLWQWQRPQVGFHVANFREQRALKRQLVAAHANSPTPVLVLRDRPRQAAANGVPTLGPSQRDPAAMQDHAETLLDRGRYQDAIDAFRAILEVDAGYAPAYAGMGDALFRMRRYEDALAALARALSLQPDLPVAGALHRLMGRSEQELGRPDAALPHYERALQIDPADARAIELLARLQFVRERYLESFELFRTLVEIDPDNAEAHANLGATLYHLGRVADAIGSFEHALALDPTLETVRTTLDQLRTSARQ